MLARAIFTFFLIFSPLFSEEVTETPSTTAIEKYTSSFLEKSLPEKSSDSSYEHAFIKMILTLGGLLFLVFFTLWALRKISNGKIGGFSSQKKIKILEKRPLSPKTAIYLLELDGKQIFIAESQLEIKTLLSLHELDLD